MFGIVRTRDSVTSVFSITPRAGIPTQNPPLRTNYSLQRTAEFFSIAKLSNGSYAPSRSLSGRSVADLQPKRVPHGVAPLHGIWLVFPLVCRTDWPKRVAVWPPSEVVTT